MLRSYSYKLFFGVVIFSGLLIFCSCNFGPKPDKIVKITLAYDAGINAQKVDSSIAVLDSRLKKAGSKPKVFKVSGKNQIAIEIKTAYEVERLKNYVLNQGNDQIHVIIYFVIIVYIDHLSMILI